MIRYCLLVQRQHIRKGIHAVDSSRRGIQYEIEWISSIEFSSKFNGRGTALKVAIVGNDIILPTKIGVQVDLGLVVLIEIVDLKK